MKDCLSRCNKNIERNCWTRYHSFNLFLQLLLNISLQLVGIYNKWLPSLLFFTSLLHITFAVLQKPFQGDLGKLQESGGTKFGSSEKNCYFLKSPKWQHKFIWNYKRSKLVSYFISLSNFTQPASAPLTLKKSKVKHHGKRKGR